MLAALNRLTAAGGRLAPAFREVGETLLQSTEQRFQQQRAPDGTPWAPLSPKYRKRKDANRRGGPDLILALNGYLESQMRYQADDEELLFGTDRLYGAVAFPAHAGMNRTRSPIPRSLSACSPLARG